jgi:hypothetical protein
MEVIDAEFQYDRRKLTYFFHADGRIDFRELVRDLFALYKTRIWMQQVGCPLTAIYVEDCLVSGRTLPFPLPICCAQVDSGHVTMPIPGTGLHGAHVPPQSPQLSSESVAPSSLRGSRSHADLSAQQLA